MKTKRCSKCGVLKGLGEFYKGKKSRGGHINSCKQCAQEYYQNHKSEIIKRCQDRHIAQRDTILKKQRAYYQANKMRIIASNQEYASTKKGKEVARAKHRKHCSTDKGKLSHRRAQDKRRALAKEVKNNLTLNQWNKILDMQHNQCNVCCKQFTAKCPPTTDHIIPLSAGGDLTFENVQALCRSCNSKKRAKLDPQFIQTWL